MLLDNAPVHPKAEVLDEIDQRCNVIYLPPNVTSEIQPMDQGVISALKRVYRTGFLRELLSHTHDNRSNVLRFMKQWNVLNCMNVLKNAWDGLSQSTLSNPWRRLLPNWQNLQNVPTPDDDNSNNAVMTELVNSLCNGTSYCTTDDIVEWINEDATLEVFHIMTDEELLNANANLQLPVPETSVESEDEEIHETSEVSPFDEGEDDTPDTVMKMTNRILNFVRNRPQLSDRYCQELTKFRDSLLTL